MKGGATKGSLNCGGFHKVYDASRFQTKWLVLSGYFRAARTKLLTAKYVKTAHMAMYAYVFIASCEFIAA